MFARIALTVLLATTAFTAPALVLEPPVAAAEVVAKPEIGKHAPLFSVKDIEGKEQSLTAYKGKVVVLEWNNPGCPFVKKFYESGTMQKLQAEAKVKGVVWLTINSGAEGKQGNMTADAAKAWVKEAKLAAHAYITDAEGTLGHSYDAKTTPHMFVIDQKGVLAYAGAMDDKPSTDAKDIAGAKNYVTEAVDLLLAGKPVKTATTTAYGCSVKYKD